MIQSSNNLPARLLSLLLALIAVFLFLTPSSVGAIEPISYVQYTVEPGDTLWGIAGSVSAPETDRREVVHHLRDVNGLDDPMLLVGQVILIPSYR